MTIRLPAPAKVNLFLHILGRRIDGYHELESFFQFIDLCDQLEFCVIDQPNCEVVCTKSALQGTDNLVHKAVVLLQRYAIDQLQRAPHTLPSINIRLHKYLPIGAGLGGGSSNAATTLLALNHIWQLSLSLDVLAELGLQLGADVPFFVRGKSGIVKGIGEQLIAPENVAMNQSAKDWLAALTEAHLLIANPHIEISTASVFTAPDLPRSSNAIDWQQFDYAKTRNDCQSFVEKTHPEVAHLLRWLYKYSPSRMTGTGASVFAFFESKSAADAALGDLPEGNSGFVVKALQSSPLHASLKQQLPNNRDKSCQI